MRFDFLASQPQFAEHLRPVFDALPDDNRGGFYEDKTATVNTERHQGAVVCVSSIGDLKALCQRRTRCTMQGHFVTFEPRVPIVLFEHGAGFSFHGDRRNNGSYAGGVYRDKALLLPATNRWVQAANAKAYKHVSSPIIGCPKLDVLRDLPKPENERPVVCVSFHWDCRVAPETRWAFPCYAEALLALRDHADFELVAHGHPRLSDFWRKAYGELGIRYLPAFDDVCAEADVYVNDSSSTLYEFAALDRPVVVLNAPWYRRKVQHGLRFWEHADVGVQVDHPDDLLDGIRKALKDTQKQKRLRRAAIKDVYPYLGESAQRAVEVLLSLEEAA